MYDINCSLIILYQNSKVLLQKRTKDAPTLAGYWAFFGGGIEKDETPLEAMTREAYEELEFRSKSPSFLLEQEFRLEGKSGYMYVYIEHINLDTTTLVCHEGERFGWFGIDDIESLKMLKHDKEIVYKVFEAISC